MSGTIGDNVYRASGVIASAAGGGLDWQTIVTGSTLTAVAGNGYWIDTTSNACTITLPDSASNGDEIMFVDYARNWGTYGIEIDSNGLNYQGDDDESTVEYETDGTALHIVYSGATNGWIPTLDKAVDDVPVIPPNDEGIFGFGYISGTGKVGMSNLVSNTGVVAEDVAAVGTARHGPMACEYGGNKGIFGFGLIDGTGEQNITNKVSDAGVVASDTAGIGTARNYGCACDYGGDKGIFGFGVTSVGGYGVKNMTNLVSNTGTVATDQAATTGTARQGLAATEYGGDKGIFGFGSTGSNVDETNLVSNTGVVSTDVVGVGTDRVKTAACKYGEDTGIFGYGNTGSGTNVTNLVSNTGVVASDQAATTGTSRYGLGACEYGQDKGIFGFGEASGEVAITNLVSNTGVVAEDQAATTGTARMVLAACSFN